MELSIIGSGTMGIGIAHACAKVIANIFPLATDIL